MSAALTRLAARACEQPGFLGYTLARFQREQGFSDAMLALVLAVAPEQLTRLRLCGNPRPAQREEDIRQISAYVGGDPARLAEVLEAGGA